MTEHEQVWTGEQIARRASNLVWRANGSTRMAMEMGMSAACDAWQADHDALLARIAELEAELAAIKRNGYTPARDTVGGVINAEWDTPEEDLAWKHLEGEGDDE